MPMTPYQFAFHDRVATTPPKVPYWDMLKTARKLTRKEKDEIFELSRSGNGTYRLAGWAFPFKEYMNRYLVNYHFDKHFTVIYAFDATCIRSNLYTKTAITEIIKANKK